MKFFPHENENSYASKLAQARPDSGLMRLSRTDTLEMDGKKLHGLSNFCQTDR
jgi:hypothetical protein